PPTCTDNRLGTVTDLFFWSNRYHDRLYSFGFTESARNFQNDNFGRGGLGGDPVQAEAQDSSAFNNANFTAPADGTAPRMQMYIFNGPSPNRDGDLDHDVVLHELTHGLSNRLIGNARSEEHTSELQSPDHLVCRRLLAKDRNQTSGCRR